MYFLHPLKALKSDKTDVLYVRALFSKMLGGGPVVFGRGDEPILALSGFFPEDWPAVNFLSLLVYKWRTEGIALPPIAAAPVVDQAAFGGHAVGRVYFDFLELKTEAAREVNDFYHKAKPVVVAVFLGGREFEVVAATEEASHRLALRKITTYPHTPEGAATLKYSHSLVFKIPPNPREFEPLVRHVADILKQAAHLPPPNKPRVKVEKRDIYLMHGGIETEDGVIIDNEVYIYI
ncbi:MAG: hypothetical protein ABWK05_06980 [Pyrobaculum sp.]